MARIATRALPVDGMVSLHWASLALAALLFASVAALPAHGADNPAFAHGRSLPCHGIVDGKRLQPRASDFNWPRRSDVNPAEAKDIEEIYQRLIAMSRP
ncbi:hypothetical protein GCM10011611_25220 [Aliidongia dinghuensis]|uniref:Uncharacterized protein n=1 Tax=Aliidongia dinghuensis TaxID=1867774 RepID=A0A8J3E3E2_9PROT|nr:hypothetical protein [Aliidongia dinghuensis]GGF18294.1 hypothetical protein GCM10011611_25220 [Aliidongia dinghuensis]